MRLIDIDKFELKPSDDLSLSNNDVMEMLESEPIYTVANLINTQILKDYERLEYEFNSYKLRHQSRTDKEIELERLLKQERQYTNELQYIIKQYKAMCLKLLRENDDECKALNDMGDTL